MVSFFGGLALVLGYRLFIVGSVATQKGEFTVFKQIKLRALQLGPGIFFALFGAWILVTTLQNRVETSAVSPSGKLGNTEQKFAGYVPSDNELAIDPSDAIKAINTLSSNCSDFLGTTAGRRCKEALFQHKRAMLAREWKEEPKELSKVLEYLDTGRTVPRESPSLQKQIETSFNATF